MHQFDLSKIFSNADCVLNRRYRHQLLATLTVNIIPFAHGIATGWLSPTITKLMSSNSPVQFPVSVSEVSWIGSLVGLGSLCGCLIFGNLLNVLGRKICLYMLTIPHICLWIFIYSAQSVEFLYVGRFLGGITGGSSYVVLPILISEIADTNIRGTLSSTVILSVNLGILVGFILSTYLSYHQIPFLVLVLPVTFMIAMTFFPDTPQHLLRKGHHEAAEKSFKFYKNCVSPISIEESQQREREFIDLKALLSAESRKQSLSYKDFVTSPALRAFGTAIVLLIANQFSGSFAFINYMSYIFVESGSIMDPDASTILMGVVEILGAYAATFFVDRYGRKKLLLLSTSGLTIGLLLMGVFTFYAKKIDLSTYNWVPLILMTFVVFIANIGIVALLFVVLVEIMPVKIRPTAISMCLALLSFMVFIMLKVFPIYLDRFGISITMWSCGSATFLCSLYLVIFLPETKGKNMDAD